MKYVCAVATLLLFISGCNASTGKSNAELRDSAPNFVVVNLDDADYRLFDAEMLELYPGFRQLADRSISFTNLHVTTPFCGPSRAALFRGQYAHRTGVRVNIPESPLSMKLRGGYSEFLRQKHHHDELGVWLKQGGYRTMFIGKYHHNGFDGVKPPGYDDFYHCKGGRYMGTYMFSTREHPDGKNHRNPVDVYRTDQEAEDAITILRDHVKRRDRQIRKGKQAQPFFLYYAPLAPHRPIGKDFTNMVNKAKYNDWQPDLTIPMTPDFNEPDMSDKPLHRQSKPYSENELKILQDEHRCRARAVKSVDDLIVKLVAELKANDLYDNTYFIVTSDNGYQMGHHRLHNKLDPYRMSTVAPLFVCGPCVDKKMKVSHLLAHIDITPTILDLAGCPKPDFLDGKSFQPLLEDPAAHEEATWREPVVLENWQVKRNRSDCLPGSYSGMRYHDRLYIEWVTGDREFYDLNADPYELENAYSALSDEQKSELHNDLIESRAVEMDPIATILLKPLLTVNKSKHYFVRGFAEDDRQVKSVELLIRQRNHGYWNGSGWVEQKISLPTQLSDENQQMVTWQYDIHDVVASLSSDDINIEEEEEVFQLGVYAVAIDDQGNRSEKFVTQVAVPFTTDPYAEKVANSPADSAETAK